MKLRTLASLVCLLPLVAAACGDDKELPGPTETPDSGTEASTPSDSSVTPDTAVPDQSVPDSQVAPDATDSAVTPDVADAARDALAEADAAPEAQIPEPAKLNEAVLRQTAVALDAKSLSVLPSVKGIVGLFISEDTTRPTLDLNVNDATNAAAINLQVVRETAGVQPNVLINFNSAANSNTLQAEFQGAKVNDLWLDGMVSVAVAKEAGQVVVTFRLTNVVVNGFALNGSFTVKTANLTNYPIKMDDMTITDVGLLSFTGEGTLSTPDAGSVHATMLGDGTIGATTGDAGTAGADTTIVSEGWTCTQSGPTVYTMSNFSRALDDCRADAGDVVLTKVYSCAKPGALRSPQQVTSTTTVRWLPTTPTDGKVQVTLSSANSTLADASTGSQTESVTLPWTCPTPAMPEAGAEPLPEAAAPDADADGDTDATTD